MRRSLVCFCFFAPATAALTIVAACASSDNGSGSVFNDIPPNVNDSPEADASPMRHAADASLSASASGESPKPDAALSSGVHDAGALAPDAGRVSPDASPTNFDAGSLLAFDAGSLLAFDAGSLLAFDAGIFGVDGGFQFDAAVVSRFACGTAQCTGFAQFCQISGSAGSSPSYACSPLPSSCNSSPTCTCVTAATGGQQCSGGNGALTLRMP